MYRSFQLRNFRCFKELDMPDIRRVNLITGFNNIGKTALLESLFIHAGAYNLDLTMRVSGFRGVKAFRINIDQWKMTPWDSLFYDLDTSQKIDMDGTYDDGRRRRIQLNMLEKLDELNKIKLDNMRYTPSVEIKGLLPPAINLQALQNSYVLKLHYDEFSTKNKRKSENYYMVVSPEGVRTSMAPPIPFPAIFLYSGATRSIEEQAERYGKIEILGKHDVILEALKIIEPRLRRVTQVTIGDSPMLFGDIGLPQMLPLPYMGEGVARLTGLVLAIASAPGGIVLIDEIDNGFHYTALPKLWRVVDKTSKLFETQIFATTHSRECVVAAHDAFMEGDSYDLALHRLDRNESENITRIITYDQETIEAAIEMGIEVR